MHGYIGLVDFFKFVFASQMYTVTVGMVLYYITRIAIIYLSMNKHRYQISIIIILSVA